MLKQCGIGILYGAMLFSAAAQNKPMSKQVERGRDLFTNSPKGTPCATCHTMGGLGNAVGPDLKPLASVVPPRGLVMAIKMDMTENVQEVKTAAGTFPGILKEKQGDEVDVWDLGQMPPVLRKLASKDIVSMVRTEKWGHPPTSAGYTSQELADIIAFLKWASNGSAKEVKVDDIE
jgi:mono/diheme cytochrome c family protein